MVGQSAGVDYAQRVGPLYAGHLGLVTATGMMEIVTKIDNKSIILIIAVVVAAHQYYLRPSGVVVLDKASSQMAYCLILRDLGLFPCSSKATDPFRVPLWRLLAACASLSSCWHSICPPNE